jgi:hypothetical protein
MAALRKTGRSVVRAKIVRFSRACRVEWSLGDAVLHAEDVQPGHELSAVVQEADVFSYLITVPSGATARVTKDCVEVVIRHHFVTAD